MSSSSGERRTRRMLLFVTQAGSGCWSLPGWWGERWRWRRGRSEWRCQIRGWLRRDCEAVGQQQRSRPPLGCSAVFRCGTGNGTPQTPLHDRAGLPSVPFVPFVPQKQTDTHRRTRAPAHTRAHARTHKGVSSVQEAEQRNKRNTPSHSKGSGRSAAPEMFRSSGTNSAFGHRQRCCACGVAHALETDLAGLLRTR